MDPDTTANAGRGCKASRIATSHKRTGLKTLTDGDRRVDDDTQTGKN